MNLTSTFCVVLFFILFFNQLQQGTVATVHEQQSQFSYFFVSFIKLADPTVLFMIPQISLFSNFFIKIGSYSTIYIFKNYFATIFSVLVFSFNNNKFNPNEPIRRLHAQFFCKCHLKSPASHRRWEDYRLVKLKKKPSKKKQKNTVNNTAYMIDKLKVKEVRRKSSSALHLVQLPRERVRQTLNFGSYCQYS